MLIELFCIVQEGIFSYQRKIENASEQEKLFYDHQIRGWWWQGFVTVKEANGVTTNHGFLNTPILGKIIVRTEYMFM